ncbi:Putative fluoride ion transporter CrcB [Leucobacter soli]|uniref:Fluoride-specific ion channel FluC n=2 Tax=Leucobacter soli TaxID=2812850 RepID=A0A916JX44_9MICO|nr:Putative fluoride ion transporter CrcB [Leucobacter soli]
MRATREWLRPSTIAWVLLGGCLGGGSREALTAVIGPGAPIPVAILIANLLGAFLLGLLLDSVAQRKSVGAARARLLLGTGFLGGFTTYSSLALAVAALVRDDAYWIAAAYGLGTVLLGGVATLLGMLLATAISSDGPPKRSAESRGGR